MTFPNKSSLLKVAPCLATSNSWAVSALCQHECSACSLSSAKNELGPCPPPNVPMQGQKSRSSLRSRVQETGREAGFLLLRWRGPPITHDWPTRLASTSDPEQVSVSTIRAGSARFHHLPGMSTPWQGHVPCRTRTWFCHSCLFEA